MSVSYTTETLPSIVGQVVPTKSESMKSRIKGADYYIDCQDDCPIPTTVDRIVIKKVLGRRPDCFLHSRS